jgi:protein TonB
MSKLNINKNEWLELVFEGKNKEYGAYKMRQEDGKTTMKAFFSAMALISGIAMLPIILSSFADKPIITELPIDEPLVVTRLTLPNKVEIKKELPALKSKVQKPITTKNLVNPTIVDATKAPDTDFTKPEDVGKTNTTNTATTGTEGNPETGNTNTVVVTTEPADNPNDIKPSGVLDKNPAFPGGINEFLKTVGKKFVTPELDEEKTIKILVYFVVERDGTLSNITVPKNPGFGLDIEAIRVLKSIKTKWDPGMYKGKPVRTSYSLPIVIKTQ